jgi:hypothetical protein
LAFGHGEEAHQDVRQAGGAEHQAEAERDRGDRVGEQAAGIASSFWPSLCTSIAPW